jgi:hypothetical protein
MMKSRKQRREGANIQHQTLNIEHPLRDEEEIG